MERQRSGRGLDESHDDDGRSHATVVVGDFACVGHVTRTVGHVTPVYLNVTLVGHVTRTVSHMLTCIRRYVQHHMEAGRYLVLPVTPGCLHIIIADVLAQSGMN